MAKKIYNRNIILDTAISIAKEVGFDKLSIRGIARKLNTSVSPVYDSFESKHDILQAIIVKIIDENAISNTYKERNYGILTFGLKYPILYRDIQTYTRRYHLETTHPEDINALMKKDPRYKGLSDEVLRSMNFDIIIYISGLVQLKLSDTADDFDDNFYYNTLDALIELLLIAYIKAQKGEIA